MTPTEKHANLTLVRTLANKLGVTAKDLHDYEQAKAIIEAAEANGTDPRDDAAKLTHYANRDQLVGALQGLAIVHMVEEIIQVEGLLI